MQKRGTNRQLQDQQHLAQPKLKSPMICSLTKRKTIIIQTSSSSAPCPATQGIACFTFINSDSHKLSTKSARFTTMTVMSSLSIIITSFAVKIAMKRSPGEIKKKKKNR
ncbi:hypothetical protein GE21DRAFT_5880 [Neurospora crassa]|uniref:Transmembrane protein n=1 Tax=Neurospora crassa (strain ATCC 24698 / 74-OR23-1A / CBS 708.71 / DSM 1257 / FGSC 987) TaxID=367110 RepID=V5ING4_NEUCR|nr:hypothetical protein NCU16794 [Neurospora crassa OR74A]ESA42900.1 hypothetical protein NCU16794 [Neurospora crassa OR74A]KHE85554.1 hypothetical protein GE21DRAFT_5880 [Neurospora crassa]|eukprot:XP_011394397.1 hypothetical protein NCU16794 [Neurospora crassa OR74A]